MKGLRNHYHEFSGKYVLPYANNSDNKFLCLELIRFICSLGVLIFHYQHFYEISGSVPFVPSEQPLRELLAPFYDYGVYGVQIFWGISGFIFFWKYGTAVQNRRITFGRFFWLRFSRLYPLHLLTLLLVATMQPAYAALAGKAFIYQNNSVSSFVAQLALATQWGALAPYTFNGPIWSVSAEISVYAVFFLLVRSFGAGWSAIGGTIAAILAAQYTGLALAPLFCAGYFFAGGVAARLYMDARENGRLKSQGRLSGAALVIFVTLWRSGGATLDEQTTLMALFLGTPLLLVLAAQDWAVLERWQHAIRAAGNLTYSTYLIHFPLQLAFAVICAAMGIVPPVNSWWFFVGYLAVTLIVSGILFQRFERPAQAWIREMAFQPRVRSSLTQQ